MLIVEGWKDFQGLRLESRVGLSILMQDGLISTRVIDVPVHQDVLTWKNMAEPSKESTLISLPLLLSSQGPFICSVCLRCEKNVDYLLLAKPALQIITRRSAVTASIAQM